MNRQYNDFTNHDGLRMTLNSRLTRQVLAVLAPLLCSLLFAAVVALLPISAGAQCRTGWDASGELGITQRGQLPTNRLVLQQKGRVLTGTASYSYVTGDRKFLGVTTVGGDAVSVDGTVDGTIDGDSFSIQIFWSNRQIGVYNGKVLPSGRLDGEAWEKASPHLRQTWYSVGVLKCPPPPPVIPKVLKSTGKAKPAPTPAPPKPPFLIASLPVIPTPFHPLGIVVLGWDGGPDNPNVEVWVSIDNGAEIPAFSIEHTSQSPVWKQPKTAGIQLNLQRKHHYKFALKAGSATLSTSAFVVP